ncbi:MAG TPA: 16S rRNA processing protein RimM [Proteobacteria bacterium]|nr:16S rRNA processing protein RimM [Pseudomonadota bacterium]
MPKSIGRERGKPVALGRVVKPHGTGGVLRISPFNPESDAFLHLKTLLLRSPRTGKQRELEVREARRHKDCFLVKLDGIDSIEDADEVRGWDALAYPDELEPLEEDEYYYYELEGMMVRLESGRLVGRLKGFIRTAAHDIAVIEGDEGEFMVPWLDSTVVDIDRERGVVVIDSESAVVRSE